MAVKPRVVIGFAESVAVIGAAWCLRDAGYDVVAFPGQGRRPPLGASRSVRLAHVPAPEKDLAACTGAVEALVAAEQPVAVLPLDDAALLICDRIATAAGIGGIPVAAPVGSPTRIALDKREQLALAEKAGFAVPPTVVVESVPPGESEPPPGDGPWM